MEAIMISIKPKYVADILNGKKTIEIRKTLPKCKLPIEVYIYCTKDLDYDLFVENGKYQTYFRHNQKFHSKRLGQKPLNGKVVAKFTLNMVEEICGGNFNQFDIYSGCYFVGKECPLYFERKCCLTQQELKEYLGDKQGYAWHIDNLVVFDKPKELEEFKSANKYEAFINTVRVYRVYKPLTRAPQSYMFIEV